MNSLILYHLYVLCMLGFGEIALPSQIEMKLKANEHQEAGEEGERKNESGISVFRL